MIPVLLIAAAAVVGVGVGVVVATFWEDIVKWIKQTVKKVQEKIKQIIVGFKVFLQQAEKYIREISKHYSKNEQGRWQETIVTCEISEDKVPADILAKLNKTSEEVDISSEMQLQLGH